jgi:hypothetical protein
MIFVEPISTFNRGTTLLVFELALISPTIWTCPTKFFLVGKGLFSAVAGYGLDNIRTATAACSVSYTVNLGGSALPWMSCGSINLIIHLHLVPG